MSKNAITLSLDPGPAHSAYCLYNGRILESGWLPNGELIERIRTAEPGPLYALESPQAQDRPFGKLFRDTVIWAGRFIEAIESRGFALREVDERSVRAFLVGSQSASNSDLNQALKNHFGEATLQPCACGDGLVPGKRPGTFKKCAACNGQRYRRIPSPLSRLNEHEKSAVAVALYVELSSSPAWDLRGIAPQPSGVGG